ncbi:MAG TPA: MFS transporter, partial [Chloroflexaceae bacterium]|nr:MFS transporter [Chloroflexaceae bacterium]
MRYRLWVLFVCNLCLWSMGNGLLPLLPVYALERGATPASAGAALACAYAAVAGSNWLAGALAGALRSRRRLLVAAGLLSAAPTALLGYADRLWQVAALLAALWFCAGLGAAMVHVLTGVYAEPERRGRTFGLIMLAMPLGALIGGPTLGALAEQQGYRAMFWALAALALGTALWQLEAARRGVETWPLAVPGGTPATLWRAPGAGPAPVVVILHGFAGSRQL